MRTPGGHFGRRGAGKMGMGANAAARGDLVAESLRHHLRRHRHRDLNGVKHIDAAGDDVGDELGHGPRRV